MSILNYQQIKGLAERGRIKSTDGMSHIQPASLDLRIDHGLIMMRGETLEVGVLEEVNFDEAVIVNKSSNARVGLEVKKSSKLGEPIKLKITSNHFHLRIDNGEPIAQMIFRKSYVNGKKSAVSIDFTKGYVSKPPFHTVDFSRRDLKHSNFWKPVSFSDELTLRKDKLYIFQSKENFTFLNDTFGSLSDEPMPHEDSSVYGDMLIKETYTPPYVKEGLLTKNFRMHSAGFIDPGFSGKIVFEIEVKKNVTLSPEELKGELSVFKLDQATSRPYSADTNNYQNQGRGDSAMPDCGKFFDKRE